MSRIPKIEQKNASPEAQELFQTLEKKMGKVPNIFLHMAQAPNVLSSFMMLSDAAAKTSLPRGLQEKIALLAAEKNGCEYCLAAHTMLAKMQGITSEEIALNKKASSKEQKEAIILQFVQNIIEKKGRVAKEDIDFLKKNQVSNQEIVEIILIVIVNMFTNYFNNIIEPDIDFPKVQ